MGTLGALRLAKVGFLAMPRTLAVGSIALAASVVGFGIALPFLEPSVDEPDHLPRVTLEPLPENPVRDEVRGVVRLPGGAPAADVEVTLSPLFSGEGAEQRKVRTDDRGRFAFTGVDVTPGTPFVADARFDGADFPSEVLRFGRGPSEPVTIVVASPTTETDDLTLDVESIAVVGDANGLQAVHALTIRNDGDHSYVGGLTLPLLPGANAIDPRAGLDRRHLELTDGAMVSRTPIAPGRHDITYTYVASMPRSGLRFEHSARYETSRFEVLVGGELEAAAHEGLAAAADVELGAMGAERTYRRYETDDLERGDSVEVVVALRRSSALPRVGGLAAAAILAAAIVAYPLLRRRGVNAPPPQEPAAAPEAQRPPVG